MGPLRSNHQGSQYAMSRQFPQGVREHDCDYPERDARRIPVWDRFSRTTIEASPAGGLDASFLVAGEGFEPPTFGL